MQQSFMTTIIVADTTNTTYSMCDGSSVKRIFYRGTCAGPTNTVSWTMCNSGSTNESWHTVNTNITNATWSTWNSTATMELWGVYEYTDSYDFPVPTLQDQISEIIRSRQAPAVLRSKGLGKTEDQREIRARETLRRVLGEDKFRLFLKKGFVAATAKSGLVYQISADHITQVWDCGKLVDRLCVYLQGGFPPTDSVIVKYLMVLNNEDQFRSLARKHTVSQMPKPTINAQLTPPSLVEVYEDLKKQRLPRRHRIAA